MSSVEFDEPKIHYKTIDISGAVTHNTPFLIRHHIVKNLKQANITMVVISVICLIITGALIKYYFYTSPIKYKEDYSKEELRHMFSETVDQLPVKPNPNEKN